MAINLPMDVASLSVKSRRDSISNANEEPLVGDLGLELAATDSPEFRARLQNYEDDIEHLALWLDTVTKLLRNILDSSACTRLHCLACLFSYRFRFSFSVE